MKEILIDFGIPAMLILGSFILLILGIDGEVKTILLLASGWAFKSGITRATTINKKAPEKEK